MEEAVFCDNCLAMHFVYICDPFVCASYSVLKGAPVEEEVQQLLVWEGNQDLISLIQVVLVLQQYKFQYPQINVA